MAREALVSLHLIIETFVTKFHNYIRANPFQKAEVIKEEGKTFVTISRGYAFFNESSIIKEFVYLERNILEEAKSAHKEVWSLKSILELHHVKQCEELNDFREILEAIPKFRDLFQDLINKSQLLFSESRIFDELKIIYQDLKKARKEIDSFNYTMKKIITEYNAKLDQETSNKESPLADEDFGGNTKDMVGVYDEEIQQLTDKLKIYGLLGAMKSIAVVGMAGIGKTTIVKALYNDPYISEFFDIRAFVKVGPNYHLKDILLDLLTCLSPKNNKLLGMKTSERELKWEIYKFLADRRVLIVLDDVWDIYFWDYMRFCFPEESHGSRIILTTRLFSVANKLGDVLKIRFRNEEESWNLFCRKVFVEDSCPPGLKKVGKKIVKKCGGLPIGIISIANILSKAKKTLGYWKKVAKNEDLLALATEEGSHMSESLFLSYKNLPPHLKECCLYIGVFPMNHKISVSKLVKLWIAEGLVEPRPFETFEDTAHNYLEDLVSHNIVLVRKHSSSGRNKTCSTHYFFWHLLVRVATNKKIFHLINNYPSAFSEDIHCQRRLCIHKNALLGLKHVSESIQSVSNVHSFLCTGPKHQYPVSICSGLTSIKVLDALTTRLYKFPIGILDLVELKYLAFTYDGKLPSSISRLRNLIYLIVQRYHLTVINSSPSYMPIEIWNMQELRHLQVMGSDLPRPVNGAQLPNLLTLLGVSDHSCTKEVLQSIPNLKKLGVQIVLPQGASKTLRIFDHLALLSRLKSFKCIVSNPNPRSHPVLLLPKSVFPSSLTKLTLSGCGFAWEDMSIIGSVLENLLVLKLRCYAIQGPEWKSGLFKQLKYLLLEDTNLVHLEVGYGCFPQLERLIIMHCYKLEEISYEHGNLMPLKMIKLVDCSPSALKSMKQILDEQRKRGNHRLRLHVVSSFDNKPLPSMTPYLKSGN